MAALPDRRFEVRVPRPKSTAPQSCTIGDCTRPAVARIDLGIHLALACGTHYQRHRRGRPLEPPLRPTGLERVTVRLHPQTVAALRRIYPGIDLAAAVRERLRESGI